MLLPDDDAAANLLRWAGVDPVDAREVLAARPDRAAHPQIWRRLEVESERLLALVGSATPPGGSWPALPPSTGAVGECFWVWVVLAALPAALALHRRRGVPADITQATLADIGRQLALYRRARGRAGLETQWWLVLHLTGHLYELGRLQYTPYRLLLDYVGPMSWYDAGSDTGRRVGWRPGDPALGLHIPATGPLGPEACDASLALARDFFDEVLPAPDRRVVTCTSWLMDEQLLGVLSPSSRIAAFQRRFTVVPGRHDGDGEILQFVFGRRDVDPDKVPVRTTLERAVVRHLSSGGHWDLRTGWLEL